MYYSVENLYLSIYFTHYLTANCSSARRLSINTPRIFVSVIEAAWPGHVNFIDFNFQTALDDVYKSRYFSLMNIVTCVDYRWGLDW
jgi:hypothetical protein